MKLRQISILEFDDPERKNYLTQKILHILKEIPLELKELVLMYLVKMPAPFVRLAKSISQYDTLPTAENYIELTEALKDIGRLPLAILGFGLAIPAMPAFGYGAGAIGGAKVLAWFLYLIYRAAIRHPQFRQAIKKILPKSFLDHIMQQEIDNEISTKAATHRSKEQELRHKRSHLKPNLLELPKREEKQNTQHTIK